MARGYLHWRTRSVSIMHILAESGEGEKRSQARALDMLERLIREKLYENWQQQTDPGLFNQVKKDVIQRQLSPRKAVNRLFS